MREARAQAHPNVALVKYWGKSNSKFNVPATPSVSISLGALKTQTIVKESRYDQIVIDGKESQDQKILNWLKAVREAHELPPIVIASDSNFPANSGLASSASGFAALAEAIDSAFDLAWDLQKKASWARLGSASAARSITGCWSTLVPNLTASDNISSCEISRIHDETYWDLQIVVAITETGPKPVASTQGMHLSSETSAFYASWVESTQRDFEVALVAIQNKDFDSLAKVAESSCRKMHALMLSTNPPLRYWNPTTLRCLDTLEQLQNRLVPVFYSIDAGPQVKAVCTRDATSRVADALNKVPGVRQIVQSDIGGGVR